MSDATCPLCPRQFDHEVQLRFHIAREHPGAIEATRPMLREIRARDRAESAPDPNRMHPALEALFRHGCPCEKSYTRHMKDWRDRMRQPFGAPERAIA